MNECNSIENNSLETIDKTNLSEQTKFQLDEISKIENYFIQEINQRKSCSQKLNKYVTTFDYIDKVLIVLSATTGGVSLKEKDRYEMMKVNLRNRNGESN